MVPGLPRAVDFKELEKVLQEVNPERLRADDIPACECAQFEHSFELFFLSFSVNVRCTDNAFRSEEESREERESRTDSEKEKEREGEVEV